jgi:hypothetical protein
MSTKRAWTAGLMLGLLMSGGCSTSTTGARDGAAGEGRAATGGNGIGGADANMAGAGAGGRHAAGGSSIDSGRGDGGGSFVDAPDTGVTDATPSGDIGDARGAPDGGGGTAALTYDQVVLADHPVGYWAMSRAAASEPDLTGKANAGTYHGGTPTAAALPNGDTAADFNGSSQYLSISSQASFSIPTTGNLTWEAWIRPDVLQFPNDGGGGYVDWMGKCAEYAPSCEWEARLYDTTNSQNRCNRLSAYVFNPGAGLGSGADWQPACGLLQAGGWYHVVGEYTTLSQPAACPNSAAYPGAINIWVDGVPWSQPSHNPTGCMGQYNIVPRAGASAVNIGSMALDTWFQGAVGKVAIYDALLSQAQITAHYRTMTGQQPSGTCGNTCTLSP